MSHLLTQRVSAWPVLPATRGQSRWFHLWGALVSTPSCLVAANVKGLYLKSMVGGERVLNHSDQHTDETTTCLKVPLLLQPEQPDSAPFSPKQPLYLRSNRNETNTRRLADNCVISSHIRAPGPLLLSDRLTERSAASSRFTSQCVFAVCLKPCAPVLIHPSSHLSLSC